MPKRRRTASARRLTRRDLVRLIHDRRELVSQLVTTLKQLDLKLTISGRLVKGGGIARRLARLASEEATPWGRICLPFGPNCKTTGVVALPLPARRKKR